MHKKLTLVAIVLLVGGVVYTWWDYRQWRHAEFDHFGQGPAVTIQLEPALPLASVYSHAFGQFRVRPPLGWAVIEDWTYTLPKLKPTLAPQQRVKLVSFQEPKNQAQINIYLEKNSQPFSNFVNQEAKGVVQEREYTNNGSATLVILTWQNIPAVQKAITSKDGQIFVIEAICGPEFWKTYAKTFADVYQSLVLL